ncbi:MAG: DoxX family protein [Candidatus Baltobacteraceae bacterium]
MPSHWTYAGWFTFLRLYTGVFWLVHGVPKFLNGLAFMPPDGFMAKAVQNALLTHHGFYHDFLANVVVPNMALFAELDRLAEVLVGCALVLGIFTRFAGFVGCFLALNYFTLNGGFGSWMSIGSLDAAAFVLSLMFLVVPAGRVAGVDALLYRPRVARERVLTPEIVNEPPQAPPA